MKTKKDLFVVIYCCIWLIIGTIGTFWSVKHWDSGMFVVAHNVAFLTITSSFVFIKPVRKWVDKHIIDKLP